MLVQFYVAVMGLVFGRIADSSISHAFLTIGIIIVLSTLVLRVYKVTVHLKSISQLLGKAKQENLLPRESEKIGYC